MYMRSLVEQKRIELSNFTIDAASSTGWRHGVGPHILPSAAMQLQPVEGADDALTENRLRDWLRETAEATV
jgi:hypothetical protein